MRDDGIFTPWPPVRHATSESAKKLALAGVEVIPLILPDVQEAVGVTFQIYGLDGGTVCNDTIILSRERSQLTPAECMSDLVAQGDELPVQSVKNANLAAIKGSSLEELFDLNAARAKIQSVSHKLWLDNKLDAILVHLRQRPPRRWISGSMSPTLCCGISGTTQPALSRSAKFGT